MTDNINHPPHYTKHPSGVECIEITEHMGFNPGNAIKYIWRADLKGDAVEDLKKARWYIDREIQRLEKKNKSGDPTKKIPGQFYVRDANGNITTVSSEPLQTTITLLTHGTGADLTPYGAYALGDALKAHATARRDELFGQGEWEIDE